MDNLFLFLPPPPSLSLLSSVNIDKFSSGEHVCTVIAVIILDVLLPDDLHDEVLPASVDDGVVLQLAITPR